MRVLDLFSAAAGGWSLGMHRAGYRTIAACEVIDWRRTLYSENNPGVPVYDDVTTLTADRLVRDGVGLPDIIVGSPPCQDISSANTKGKGVDGERSGLYFEAVRLVDECRPRWFALENSSNLRTRGADRVIDAMEAIGYTCWPFVVSAGDIGANHPRKRSWLIGVDVSQIGNTSEDGCGQGRPWRRVESVEGVSEQACGDADAQPTTNTNGKRREAGWLDGGVLTPEVTAPELVVGWSPEGLGNPANSNEARQEAGLLESSLRQAPQPVDGCCDVWGDDVPDADGVRESDSAFDGEMGWRASLGGDLAEPWADWNSGLAHHLRVDDGLSAWVAESRIAVGGPRGTVAASLIVEAFGDAVVPQIPEAIGRAIYRVEAALAALHPANDNNREAA